MDHIAETASPYTYELDDVICAWLKNSLLQKLTTRHYKRNDHRLCGSVTIALNKHFDVSFNCFNTKAISLLEV